MGVRGDNREERREILVATLQRGLLSVPPYRNYIVFYNTVTGVRGADRCNEDLYLAASLPLANRNVAL